MKILAFERIKKYKEILLFFLFAFIMFIVISLYSEYWAFRVFGITGLLVFLIGMGSQSLKRFGVSLKIFPLKWRKFLCRNSLYYPYLDWRNRRRFERNIKIFLSELHIKRIDGSKVGWEPRLLVAAGLATVLLGRPKWELPLPKYIFVLSRDQFNKKFNLKEGKHAAAATREALFLTEESLTLSFDHAKDGYNDIYHEIAHYFDMEDLRLNGLPSIVRFKNSNYGKLTLHEWEKTLYTELGRAVVGELQMRYYAVTCADEFFACASEYFFQQPEKLKKNSEALYDLLVKFYNFDPVELLQQHPRLREF